MMFSSNACYFVLFLFLSLSANAETVRGVHRELLEQSAIPLGYARNYAILAKTGITTVPTSVITGDIAVSPGSSTAMTGFSFTLGDDEQLSQTTQVVGGYQAFAPDFGGGIYETRLNLAVLDMEAAYNNAAGWIQAPFDAARENLAGGLLDGVTLTPGVYTFTTGVTITGDIYFDGTSNDVFIIQIAGTLVQEANKRVILSGGAVASNIFWQVTSTVAVKAGAHMEGVLLSKTQVTFITGSTLNGRVLAQTACVLQVATITAPFDPFTPSR
jgi:hypothetical protein